MSLQIVPNWIYLCSTEIDSMFSCWHLCLYFVPQFPKTDIILKLYLLLYLLKYFPCSWVVWSDSFVLIGYPRRWAFLARLGLHALIPRRKKPIQQTYKVRNFLDNVGKGVKKKKKKAEDSQGNEDINDCPWFTVLKNTVGFLSWLSKQKALLIPNKAKSFCFIINLLLTKLIRSRWLIISLNPFF